VQKERQALKVALVGNPNSGKSSIFNFLTGLQQKVGNFPGVTIDRKAGQLKLSNQELIELIDFPGTYSLYPTSSDEKIMVQSFINPDDADYPDAIVYVADLTKLEKHLLLFTQIRDLGLPTVLALNMSDLMVSSGLSVDIDKLTKKLGVPVILVSGRSGAGVPDLKALLVEMVEGKLAAPDAGSGFYRLSQEEAKIATTLESHFPNHNPYQRIILAHHYKWLPFLKEDQKKIIEDEVNSLGFQDLALQVRETMQRFDNFTPIVQQSIKRKGAEVSSLSERMDYILTHRIAGPLIFFITMLLVFQAIFSWANYPMDLIDIFFAKLTTGVSAILPPGWFTDLITEGLLAGLGGVLVFIPQIAILFFLISLLEEVGYMARAAFMFDRLMQFFGLNGRSIIALISGGACAIPAIMSTRTIANWKERLITILVTPFISCSARIPVYATLIVFAVPAKYYMGGLFSSQGLAFMLLYLLGIAAALLSALVFKYILKTKESSFLMLELPSYRMPVLRNVGLTVWEKVKAFTLEAGKVIILISLVLWILSSYGPGKSIEQARLAGQETARELQLDEAATANFLASKEIEASYAGKLGKWLEPAIEPLGFDWKIGIALITSFAAREVFVGTMATLYSIGSDAKESTIRERMAMEVNPKTGEKVYSPAASWSLLLFYVFAMQCMGTLAVVKKETQSWKWPIIQFLFMTALAYLSSLVVFQMLS